MSTPSSGSTSKPDNVGPYAKAERVHIPDDPRDRAKATDAPWLTKAGWSFLAQLQEKLQATSHR